MSHVLARLAAGVSRWRARWLGGRSLGNSGERAAERFLRRAGLRILERQHRTKAGEIDLIAADGATVVFVEVKTRRGNAAGRPEEAVTLAKQRRITRLALAYLKRREWLGSRAVRFDVVAVTWPPDGSDPQIVHFPHAFEAVGVHGMFS